MNAIRRQPFRNDLLRFGVDHQMQLAPCSAFALAVRSHPKRRSVADAGNTVFALAIDLQAGAVDDNVNLSFFVTRSTGKKRIKGEIEFRRSFAQRGVIGDRQVELHQSEHPFPETFCRSIRQLVQFADGQERFDGKVAVKKRSSLESIGIIVTPFSDHFVGNPKGEVASIDESLVILPSL